jgi:glycogen debranching enzyme
VPSVPLNSNYFDPLKYWQGPTWVNTNWLIIDGLERYGFKAEADVLKKRTLEMSRKSGMHEYFNPLNAQGAGAPNFSWTAALVIDLLKD